MCALTRQLCRVVMVVLAAWMFQPAHARILITEFVASNITGYLDDDKKTSDWIELYNDGPAQVNLGGYWLTDSSGNLKKWQFPSTNITAGGRLIVFASGRDRRVPGKPLHTNFSLSESGEYLAVVRPDGFTIEFEYKPLYPPQFPDISYGLGADNSTKLYFSSPTPGSANNAGEPEVAPPPTYSKAEGIYTDEVQVELSSTIPGAKIYYTVNGSEPTTASLLYTDPLEFTNSTVVRARVYAEGFIPSPTASRTFWVAGPDVVDFTSNLPIVVFSSFGRGISETSRTAVSARFLDKGPNGRASLLQTEANFAGRGIMRIRGSSSTQFPKKSYALELVDEKGDDQPASLLGLPADSDWVMYAPYTDKTLMRDVLAYELSNRIGRYAPRTRFVEVYVDPNGKLTKSDYVGVYALVEKLTINPARVNIDELLFTETSEELISGGYLLKNDRLDPGDVGFSTSIASLAFVDPKEREMPSAQKNWIRSWFNTFENALRGPNYRNPTTGYAAYIDTGSFIDHHLLVEMAKNIDGYRLSTFMYKPRGGKLVMGPIWDYNLTFGNANYLEGWRTNGWYSATQSGDAYPWYNLRFRDPDFTQAYTDRWAELRRTVLLTDFILGRVDEIAAELEEAQVRNYQKWRILGQYVWPNWYIGRSYADEVNWMKNWIRGRLAWMDNAFTKPPVLNRNGGSVMPGFTATLQAALSTHAVYYTLDGSDPRLSGGSVSPKAVRYTEGIPINSRASLFARSKYNNLWSPPVRAEFFPVELDAAWLAWYFTQAELGDPSICGNDADPDGDGLTNIEEFLAATDPRDASDALRLEIGASQSNLALSFKARAGKTYVLQSKDPHPEAPWVDVDIITAKSDEQVFSTLDPNSTLKFYRLLLQVE